MSRTPRQKTHQHPNEDPNSAYSILQDLREHNTPVTPTQVGARPNAHSTPSFRTLITTSTGIPHAPAGQLPHPRPLPSPQNPAYPPANYYSTLTQQQILTPDSITTEALQNRLAHLIRTQLPRFQPDAIVKVANRLTQTVISTGKAGKLGPHGLCQLSNIFTCIAHEGPKHKMCIAVAAPGAGHVKLLLVGDLCEKDGLDPLVDEGMMDLCRRGFGNVVLGMYKSLLPVKSTPPAPPTPPTPPTPQVLRWM
ncbi:hypothetical protein NX059_010901 [Plenodomus lindquistii]|nr:hypothetical protein NX059_010901 [Plenodomus lindquistii]